MTSLDTRETALGTSGKQHIEMSPFGNLVLFPVVPDIDALQRKITAEREASQTEPLIEFIGETILTRESLRKNLTDLLIRQEEKIQRGARIGSLATWDYAAIPTL